MSLPGNPLAFRKPITLDTLDELFAHHRHLTGGWSMENEDPPSNDDPPEFAPITSQEELDRRIGPRLAREREKYGDYDELKRKAAEFDKQVEESRTEQEKAVEAARKEGETAALERANSRLIASEAKVLVASAGAINPAAAARLLGDLADIEVDADGNVDEKALQQRVDALKESDPYLFGTTREKRDPKPDRSQGGGGGADTAGVDRGREMFASRRKKTS